MHDACDDWDGAHCDDFHDACDDWDDDQRDGAYDDLGEVHCDDLGDACDDLGDACDDLGDACDDDEVYSTLRKACTLEAKHPTLIKRLSKQLNHFPFFFIKKIFFDKKMRRSSVLKMLLGLLPLFALASAVTWIVYTANYAQQDNKQSDAAQKFIDQSTIAFQGVVATVLIYFVSHHGIDQAMMLMGRM